MIGTPDIGMDLSLDARLKRFARRIIDTRYFFVAFLIHVSLLAIFGANIISKRIENKGSFDQSETLVVIPPQGSISTPPPPEKNPQDDQPAVEKVKASASRTAETSVKRIQTSKVDTDISIPPPPLPSPIEGAEFHTVEGLPEKLAQMENTRLKVVRDYLRDSVKGRDNKPGVDGRGPTTVAKFTCYVGRYKGGDWDCNFGFIADKRWYSNCIYNLMLQISRWTKGNVKAMLKPEFLDLASREWIEKVKPPFIFITGHQDFILDETEAQNLREYLMLGGALWVDSSLPGRRSRFDVALRREMKKVLPDRDFEKLGNHHPLYNSYFNFPGPPAAMNFYKEPLEVIKVGAGEGDVAVLYTLNAYSDLWETGLTDKDKIDTEAEWSPEKQHHVYRWGPHYQPPGSWWAWQNGMFYRDVTEPSIHTSYKFGINLVIYLLTRYQDKLIHLAE